MSRYLLPLAVLLLPGCLDAPSPPDAPAASGWRYDPAAPYHGYLPMALQDAVQEDPRQLAARICDGLAGQLEFISSERRNRVDFTCRFEEGTTATSVEFGALVPAGAR